MDNEKFESIVTQEVGSLSRKQRFFFSWRCALRVLPFLGTKGYFYFWSKESRKEHLYAVLYALDATHYVINADANIATERSIDAQIASTHADRAYIVAANSVDADRSADAAFAAASSASDHAVVVAVVAAHSASISNNKNLSLKQSILQDLSDIKANKPPQVIGTEWYGDVWNDFQNALEAVGCGYWGELYKGIFNSATLDKEALARRIQVPEEIRSQGAAAVASYLQEMERTGATRLNEARIIILGDKGVGKTCIARRLVDPTAKMTTDDESTAGVNTLFWKLDDENINVRIWDFAGHTVTHAVHQFFLSERSLYIMVYDGRTEDRNRLSYWLDQMTNYGGDSQAIILVNQRDQHSVDLPVNYLKEHYSIAGIYTFSIKNDSDGLLAFRKEIATFINNNPSWNEQEIPNSYYHVKDALERLFLKQGEGSGQEHICRDEFDKLAEKYNVDDKEALLKSLHSLGISLWYGDMEGFDTLVLNPEWISHGVYKIINWVNEEKKHSLILDDFLIVFSGDSERYPQEKHPFLFKLMKRYELAYETKSKKTLIIPHLLKEDRPKYLPEFPIDCSLMIRYKADEPLPPHSISRFIVRHHEEIEQKEGAYLVWRYGVILRDNAGSRALVRQENKNTISVSIKGENKTEYLSQLRETLNAIFDSYKSTKPELQYRVFRYGLIPDEVENKNPLWLSGGRILRHKNADRALFDDVSGLEITLNSTVNNYNIQQTENSIIGGEGHQLNQTTNTFNFPGRNIDLQGNLNELARLLGKAGHQYQAEELTDIAKDLEGIENLSDRKEVKKTGIINGAKRLLEELEDEKSVLNKSIKGIKNAKQIALDLTRNYGHIVQWLGS